MTEADYIPVLKKLGETCFDEDTIDCTSVFTDAGIPSADIDSCELKLCKQPGNKSCVGNASFKGNAWSCDCMPLPGETFGEGMGQCEKIATAWLGLSA